MHSVHRWIESQLYFSTHPQVGKWHLGQKSPVRRTRCPSCSVCLCTRKLLGTCFLQAYLPSARGFERFVGYYQGLINSPPRSIPVPTAPSPHSPAHLPNFTTHAGVLDYWKHYSRGNHLMTSLLFFFYNSAPTRPQTKSPVRPVPPPQRRSTRWISTKGDRTSGTNRNVLTTSRCKCAHTTDGPFDQGLGCTALQHLGGVFDGLFHSSCLGFSFSLLLCLLSLHSPSDPPLPPYLTNISHPSRVYHHPRLATCTTRRRNGLTTTGQHDRSNPCSCTWRFR